MNRKDETTGRLEKALQQTTDQDQAQDFTRSRGQDEDTFYHYLNHMITARQIHIPQLISDSGISKNYVYQILNGRRKNPGRDKILALCVAAGMSFTETNRALKIAGVGILYAKDERDIRIAIAINNGIRNVTRLNLILDQYGLPVLDI